MEPPNIKKKSPLSGLSIFKRHPLPLLQKHDKLQTILKEKLGAIKKKSDKPDGNWDDVAFAIADITKWKTPGAQFPYAGVNDENLCYSGSLLKVAAMYAAFELRAVATMVAEQLEVSTREDLFKALAGHLDGIIARSVELSNKRVLDEHEHKASLTREMVVPHYGDVFTATRAGRSFKLSISEAYEKNITLMIEGGENLQAAKCIHRLGYAWINAVYQHGGFQRGALPGIWLAGDYLGEKRDGEKKWPYARVLSTNDDLVAQATTARDMVALFTLIKTRSAKDEDKDATAMMTHLRGAPQWLSSSSTVKREASKVGLGELKLDKQRRRRFVSSEGSIRYLGTEENPTHVFAIVWQNVEDTVNNIDYIGEVVDTTVHAYTTP